MNLQPLRQELMADLPDDLDSLIALFAELNEVSKELGDTKDRVKAEIDKHMKSAGIPVKEKSPPRRSFSAEAKNDLLRVVLDSRRFNKQTGEAIEETQLDKVLHVFPLDKPRVRALEDRGIDPDEWSQWK